MGRWALEASGALEPRKSALEDDFEDEDEKEEEDQAMDVDTEEYERVNSFFFYSFRLTHVSEVDHY